MFLIYPENNAFYTPGKYDIRKYLWVAAVTLSFDGSLVKHFPAHMPFSKDKPYENYKEDMSRYFKDKICVSETSSDNT